MACESLPVEHCRVSACLPMDLPRQLGPLPEAGGRHHSGRHAHADRRPCTASAGGGCAISHMARYYGCINVEL